MCVDRPGYHRIKYVTSDEPGDNKNSKSNVA
jgi:hypothetical protein